LEPLKGLSTGFPDQGLDGYICHAHYSTSIFNGCGTILGDLADQDITAKCLVAFMFLACILFSYGICGGEDDANGLLVSGIFRDYCVLNPLSVDKLAEYRSHGLYQARHANIDFLADC
jgi:hypothetical protein